MLAFSANTITTENANATPEDVNIFQWNQTPKNVKTIRQTSATHTYTREEEQEQDKKFTFLVNADLKSLKFKKLLGKSKI